MRILILGASGQLGSEINCIKHKFTDDKFFFASKKDIDITNKFALNDFVKANNIEGIVNCAAYTNVDAAEENVDLAYSINAYAIKNIVEVCTEYNVKLIHISTDYVFDGLANIPYKEHDKVNPEGVYAKSKLLGESYIMKSSCKAAIIRTSWLYSSFSNNFMKTIIRIGKANDSISIVSDQYGTPCYARDLAYVSIGVLHNIKQQEENKSIYHYSNKGVASWYDFAHAINELCKLKTSVKAIFTYQYPTKAKRPPYSVLDKSKIEAFLNIEIPHWRDSLRKCVDNM